MFFVYYNLHAQVAQFLKLGFEKYKLSELS